MANYYDIQDILMQDEVARGSVVDLPLWLAQDLVQRQILHIKLPSCFNARHEQCRPNLPLILENVLRVRKEVQADPACVDLHSKCPFYYEMGCKLVELSVDPTLGPFLLTTLQGRYKDLLCKALTATLSGNLKFLPHLTEEETRLFEAGRDSVKAFKKWRLQGPRIEKAAILGRKRNRDATPIWS
uniref:GINS subunit domain-containing protein n=1 Tax=Physcomitrium patens TaxID=3218 RepID=A0A7I4CYS3_PHYPA|nr:DNA replication complex GINS protein PSF3-like isoform X3 [Physcomitrium patens]|eukprot:XP_024365107.1 DNA replication complex GINS protein PSF3-like isoform X3 [Physcomitrella patens]